jgi:ABC-type lipoprotein release transport system permease subunit
MGIGMIGSLMGVILGVGLNIPLVVWGWDMTALLGKMDIGYRVIAIIRGIWNIQAIAGAFFAGTIMTTLVAMIPTRKAIKMEVTECLRYQ